MHLTTILLFKAFLTASTFVGAIPQGVSNRTLGFPISKTESAVQSDSNDWGKQAFAQALEHGIDPTGPHPSDFLEHHGDHISFKAGSKFAIWAAAQSGRTDKAHLERRNSDLNVMYAPFCLVTTKFEG